ncbi:hypothetical protein DEM27_09050 [Metarhizobium album]|uniref:Uncharacterized protein n=1 Tax=Metarhizobium album TaxID=2182425 RepID=A0A2U2DT91_9HYPH|nr:hypothetical protein [Rhizobium album]PWE56524.1 hypothetical protein DEM27_09050 [Rhizobium album]
MNEKVENLILEHLRVIRADVSSLKEEVSGIRAEMRSMKQHMAAFMSHETAQDGDIAAMKLQLERIGKRLDIVE